jgi:putative ABC transport system substrate-binding protein
MDRRAFLGALGLLVGPRGAGAQPAGKAPRIAFLTTTAPGGSPPTDAFLQGLRDLGYIPGQNITIEWRWGHGNPQRLPDFASEVAKLNVDIIVAANDVAGRAARQATKTIPIVIATIGDPVGGGFVDSLARPGGNVTGLTMLGPDTGAKRLQILKEAFPHLSRVGLLVDVADLGHGATLREIVAAAPALQVQIGPRVDVNAPDALAGAFATSTKGRAMAVVTVGGTTLYANRVRLAQLAVASRLPMMCGPPEFVAASCLMGYSTNLAEAFRRAAVYVDKILKGAKPGDLPIEQPTKFELVINLKTAKALGLTIPPSLLQRTDQVIE